MKQSRSLPHEAFMLQQNQLLLRIRIKKHGELPLADCNDVVIGKTMIQFREIVNSENRRVKFGGYLNAINMSSSTSTSGKEINPHSKKALEEVNKHVKDVFDILNRETSRARKEMEALDEAAKKLEHVHFSEMVKLNVGGHFFSTSLATLNKDPGDFE